MPVASTRNDGEEKPTFKCGECGKLYSRSEYLRRHERKHQDSKPFPCTECTKSFARSDVLLRHRRKCHPDAPESSSAAGPSRTTAASSSRQSPPDVLDPSSSNSPVTVPSASTSYQDPSFANFGDASSSAAGPSRTNGASSSRDARRDAAAPYTSQPHLNVPTPSNRSSASSNQQYPDQTQFQVDPNLNLFEQFAFQQQQQQQQRIGSSSSPAGSPSSSFLPPSQQPLLQPNLSMNGTAYYPPTEGADPLSLLALSVPNYLQQQSTPQPQLSQYPYPQQQQQNDSQAAASYLFAQHGQPQTSTNYFPSPGDPSSSSAVPSNMTSATQLTLSPTMHNQNPAFLAPERAVHSEWYPMFSPSILSPLGLSSSSQPLLNGTPSSSSNLNNVSSNGDVSYFPSKPWAPSPGSFFDSLTTGLSPHPEAEFLFDGMSDMDAEGSVEELEGEAVVEPDAEKQNRDNTLAAEKVVLGAEWSNRFTKSGLENYAVKESDPYFISGDRFLGCYSVEHWQIPPISTLTKIARRTLTQLAPHLPMIHVPTFVLKEAPGCLAFSMCTVGGPRRGGGRWDVDRGDPSTELGGVREENDVVKRRPVQNALFEAESSEEDGWDGIKSVVKREKTDMLIKSFTRSRGVLFTEYNVGLLQALILYNAPAFLSDSQGQRMSAQLGLGTIVNIARQVGIFDPTNGHVAPDSDSSKSGFTCEERTLPAIWKRWARWEGIRRTAYIVFLLDTVACLESSTALHIASSELSSFPLPASESIWEAPTAEAWSSIVTATGHSYSLGDIVTKLTTLLATGESDCLAGGRTLLGPFGWLVTIVVLVREVLDFGEGKIRDPNMRWMAGVPQERVGEELQTALMRWRRGWDYDDQCRRVDPPSVYSGEDVDCCFITPASNSNGSTTGSTSSPETTSTPSSGTTGTGSGTSSDKEKDNRGRQPYSDEIFCREALPFWWFAKILLDTILPPASSQSSVPAPFGNGQPAVPAGGFKAGVNQFKEKGIVYRDVLNSARTFSRAGEGRFFG